MEGFSFAGQLLNHIWDKYRDLKKVKTQLKADFGNNNQQTPKIIKSLAKFSIVSLFGKAAPLAQSLALEIGCSEDKSLDLLIGL